jgi:hypothetical protein
VASKDKNEGAKSVKSFKNGDGKKRAKTGKPRRVVMSSMRSRFASGGGGANSIEGLGGNFYSPELSTDFLELPQSLHEQWNYYRFFYDNEPFVGQALDLHSELPLSKIRIGIPETKKASRELAMAATRFCEKWAKRVQLLMRLISIVHERNLIGEAFVWFEDANPDMPEDIRIEILRTLTEEGEAVEEQVVREDADERAAKWLRKNYKGWTAVRCLPPEQVRMKSFNFTDERIFELIPDSGTKSVIEMAQQGDADSIRVVKSMPPDVVKAVRSGKNIPLNTDPEAGSFVYYLANRKSDYEPRGRSLLQRCIRILVYRDKLRQAQTSIASRHMTPIRIVYAEGLNEGDLDGLREQVDMALQDPDYSIIANFELRWEEMGADQRLLDLSSEYDLTDRQMYAGLGVTEGLLTGESSYSGDRISLEVINTRYMLLREQLQELVEEYMFKPMCARMGFVEEDEDGEQRVIVPTLSFTRLALRDNRDTFDALYNLYTKGSLDVDTILELLNLDPVEVKRKIERDLFTVNDPNFNEVMRGIYGDAGRALAENSNAPEKIAEALGLDYAKPEEEGGGRFASLKTASGEDVGTQLKPEFEALARGLISALWQMQMETEKEDGERGDKED